MLDIFKSQTVLGVVGTILSILATALVARIGWEMGGVLWSWMT